MHKLGVAFGTAVVNQAAPEGVLTRRASILTRSFAYITQALPKHTHLLNARERKASDDHVEYAVLAEKFATLSKVSQVRSMTSMCGSLACWLGERF